MGASGNRGSKPELIVRKRSHLLGYGFRLV
jgi:hypothetical protein